MISPTLTISQEKRWRWRGPQDKFNRHLSSLALPLLTALWLQARDRPHCRESFHCILFTDMEFLLDRAREFLGTTCDPQLRLVSRSFRDALAAIPRELLRVEDFLSSAPLFVWARKELRMPERDDIARMAARGGHLDMLRWLRVEGRCSWTPSVCESAAGQGHLQVLQWLRAQDPPCPWTDWACAAAAHSGHLVVLQWLRAQDSPCPWAEGTCANAVMPGHLGVLQWLQARNPSCPWDPRDRRNVRCGKTRLTIANWRTLVLKYL
jgi:hypothetical protein